MQNQEIRSVLITGANAGIGRELARQLGSRPEVERVVLGCRSPERGAQARAALEAETGRDVFEVLQVDVGEVGAARAAARALAEPVDALVMNAGGTGGPQAGLQTVDGVTTIAAVNLVGHAALFDELVAGGKVRSVAVMVGSEGSRGVPKVKMPRPEFPVATEAAFTAVLDGTHYAEGGFSGAAAYGDVKYLAALWTAAMARRHPELRIATVSPGGTRGTELAKGMGRIQGFLYDHVVNGIIARRITHTVDVGAARLADATLDPAFAGGGFWASEANTLTGPLVEQSSIQPDFADEPRQDAVAAAVARFAGTADRAAATTSA